MTAEFVPFIVLGLAVFIAIGLPLGRDLAVPIFLQPWFALTPDIGVGMSLSKILFGVLIIKYLYHRRFDPVNSPSFRIYILLLLSGFAAAMFSLSASGSDIEFTGGAFRNGWLRVLVAAFNLTLAFAPMFLLLAHGVAIPSRFLIRCICISLIILCLIGIFQFIVFVLTGVDILPLGIFMGAEEVRTGLVSMGGLQYIRPGALAGEPKSLGLGACALLLLLITMGSQIFSSSTVRYFASGVALLAMILTQSTSAFVSLCLGLAVYLGLRSMGRPLRVAELVFWYSAGAVLILAVFIARVSAIDTTGLSAQDIEAPDSVVSLLQSRTLDRLEVEDFDMIILKSMINDPLSIVTGKGLGLAHLSTDEYIPEIWKYYMQDRIIFPKTGLTFYLASGGIISVSLFIMLMVALTPGAGVPVIGRQLDPQFLRYVTVVQRAVVPLMFLAMIRIYVLELSLLVGAILAVGLQQAVNTDGRRTRQSACRSDGRRPA